MAELKKNSGYIQTPPFRISYPALFKPTSMDDKDPKFQITMVFPKGADLKALKAAAAKAVKEKFGTVPAKLKKPFLDGDEEENEQLHGTTFIRASTKNKPGLIRADKSHILEADAHEIKPGYWARAIVNAWTWSFKGKKGVSFGFQHIQILPLSFVADFYADNEDITYDIVEEMFGSDSGKAEDNFDAVESAEDDPDEYMSDDMKNEEGEETDDFMD